MLRRAYPNWSPAAIKSALMTTSYNLDNAGKIFTDLSTGRDSTPFQHGAGHVDPNKALNPGLVYDIQPSDYEAFLCSIGYNQTQISLFIQDKTVDCSSHTSVASPGDLNYPSFSVIFEPPNDSVVKHKRVVTNVGKPGDAIYRVKAISPTSAEISVSPSILTFTATNQSLSYEITFTSLSKAENISKFEFGSIEWTDSVHVVRSPIALIWPPSLRFRGLTLTMTKGHHYGVPAGAFASRVYWHVALFDQVVNINKHRFKIGFAARLTPSQASHLRLQPGFLAILPQEIHQLHTTRTPSFLGLNDNSGLWPNSEYADDVIIGVLDTGIWPESQSFNDTSIKNPVPKRWKGICESGPDFPSTSCNKKIIGARVYYKGIEEKLRRRLNQTKDSKSPRDTNGHGTHTASTAAGSVVKNAGLFEYGVGEAKGMATKARIASYKICWNEGGCAGADILAAIDQAVEDGVDVISLSVGPRMPRPYDQHPTAIGAFGAMMKGVLVIASAGNSGLSGLATVANSAPWIFTIGASTIDREFPCNVILGDGRVVNGVSLYSGKPLEKPNVDLVYASSIGSIFCKEGELNSTAAAGKIVLCDGGGGIGRADKGNAVKIAGGVGVIIANPLANGEELSGDAHLIPGTTVTFRGGVEILRYIVTQKNPTASFDFKGTIIGSSPSAPKIAASSSRGPNFITPEILKPDVIAPGVNILAAWTGAAGPTDLEVDKRRVEFNIISGTSMSCPHVSGLAAMLRKAYPNWSPAAIKSALMTTAYNLDNAGKIFTDLSTGRDSTPFQHGAGHVDPNKALNPGLVYDIQPSDYEAFLCSIGYNQTQISLFIHDKVVDCKSHASVTGPGDLNYPSFSVVFKPPNSVVKHKRVVTNVGKTGDATYRVKIKSPLSAEISVSPNTLTFTTSNKSLSYEITFTSLTNPEKNSNSTKTEFGSIEWTDSVHVVRSPIALIWLPTLQ
ncbi:hypothetical protein C5167_030052 [Papaver somniferum]|nr:hypothetical protein C5167_030052 [Papaver somniferum]